MAKFFWALRNSLYKGKKTRLGVATRYGKGEILSKKKSEDIKTSNQAMNNGQWTKDMAMQ